MLNTEVTAKIDGLKIEKRFVMEEKPKSKRKLSLVRVWSLRISALLLTVGLGIFGFLNWPKEMTEITTLAGKTCQAEVLRVNVEEVLPREYVRMGLSFKDGCPLQIIQFTGVHYDPPLGIIAFNRTVPRATLVYQYQSPDFATGFDEFDEALITVRRFDDGRDNSGDLSIWVEPLSDDSTSFVHVDFFLIGLEYPMTDPLYFPDGNARDLLCAYTDGVIQGHCRE